MIMLDDVIQRLTELREKHGNLQICKVGHFGEINEMDASDFNIYKNARNGRFGDEGKPQDVIDIWVPDIGPDPD